MTNSNETPTLLFAWLYVGIIVLSSITYLILCLYAHDTLQNPIAETQRELIRSVFYVLAIITFPLTNLLRHILIRLNETMPLNGLNPIITAKKRYTLTIIIALSAIESIALYGLILCVIGDSINNLYIFEGLALLGVFLHRPKTHEYKQIIAKLNEMN
jgi:hypothetical protein